MKPVVTHLGKLLRDSRLDHLIEFMLNMGLRFTITGNVPVSGAAKGERRKLRRCTCKIMVQAPYQPGSSTTTLAEYSGTSLQGPRAAVAKALADFLLTEECDYRAYQFKRIDRPEPESLDDQSDPGLESDWP